MYFFAGSGIPIFSVGRPLVGAALTLFTIVRNAVADRRLLGASNVTKQWMRSHWEESNNCLASRATAPQKCRAVCAGNSAHAARRPNGWGKHSCCECDTPIQIALNCTSSCVTQPVPPSSSSGSSTVGFWFLGSTGRKACGSAVRAHWARELVYIVLRLLTPLRPISVDAQGVGPPALFAQWPSNAMVSVGCELLPLLVRNRRRSASISLGCNMDDCGGGQSGDSAICVSPSQSMLLQATAAALAHSASFYESISSNPGVLANYAKERYCGSYDCLRRARLPSIQQLSGVPGLLSLRNPTMVRLICCASVHRSINLSLRAGCSALDDAFDSHPCLRCHIFHKYISWARTTPCRLKFRWRRAMFIQLLSSSLLFSSHYNKCNSSWRIP